MQETWQTEKRRRGHAPSNEAVGLIEPPTKTKGWDAGRPPQGGRSIRPPTVQLWLSCM